MTSAERIVMMANQIARNLAVQDSDGAVAGTAEHIKKFWDSRMKAIALAHMAEGGEGLTPIAHAALERLKADTEAGRAAQTPQTADP
ncbi:MAG: formate dehydrogenase subunit delta [Pseudomonadota bacterium]